MASVVVENVGGIESMERDLKKGLNLIQLPNSAGKTSFCRALELLALEEDELKDKGYYMNLFVGYNGRGRVLFQDEQRKAERVFTRGTRGLTVSGDYLPGGDTAWLVSFATLENRLITKLLNGESLKSEFERISSSGTYDASISFFQARATEGKRRYDLFYAERERELPATLKEAERLKARQEELDASFKRLPSIPKDVEAAERENVSIAVAAERELDDKNHTFKAIERDLRDIEEQTKSSNKERERYRRLVADEWNEVLAEMDEMPEAYKKELVEGGLYRRLKALRGKEIVEPIPLYDYTKEVSRALGDLYIRIKGSDARPEEGTVAYWERRRGQNGTALGQIEEAGRYVKDLGKCPVCQRPLEEHDLSAARTSLGREERKIDNELNALNGKLGGLDDITKRLDKRQTAFESAKDSLGDLNTKLVRLEKRAKELDSSIKKARENLEKAETNFEKAKEAVDKSVAKILTDRAELAAKREEVTNLLEQTNQRVKRLQDELKGSAELRAEIEEAEYLAGLMDKRKDRRLREWTTDYERQVNELFDKLGFKGFETKIDQEDYTVSLTREHPRTKTPMKWSLNALSRSEAVTVGVGMLLAAKKEYAPTFPFFVMDEVIYSYDPSRLERLKNYAQDVTDYVVMTQLAPAAR